MMKKALVLLMTVLSISGCAGLTTGKYPYPSGMEVVPEKKTMAKVNGDGFEAFQEVDGYAPDFALVGIIVTVHPDRAVEMADRHKQGESASNSQFVD